MDEKSYMLCSYPPAGMTAVYKRLDVEDPDTVAVPKRSGTYILDRCLRHRGGEPDRDSMRLLGINCKI